MLITRGRTSWSLLSSFLCFIAGCTLGSWIVNFYHVQFDRSSNNNIQENSYIQVQNVQVNQHGSAVAAARREVLLVILIMSAPNNFDQRNILRSTWIKLIPSNPPPNAVVKYYFIIGTHNLKVDRPEFLTKLQQEQFVHNDLILLESLQDSYLNLTTKLVMGIGFLSANDPFQYLLKCDDDSFVRVDVIVSELQERQKKIVNSISSTNCYHWGFFDGRAKVLKTGKWKESDYNLCDLYIPYALGGGYILSKTCTQFILKNQYVLKKFVNEDVSIGVWLAVISPERRHDVRFDTEFRTRGCNNQYIVQHKISTKDMTERYTSLITNGVLCAKEFRRRGSYEYNWNTVPSQCCKRNESII